jgi:ribosomal protein S4
MTRSFHSAERLTKHRDVQIDPRKMHIPLSNPAHSDQANIEFDQQQGHAGSYHTYNAIH